MITDYLKNIDLVDNVQWAFSYRLRGLSHLNCWDTDYYLLNFVFISLEICRLCIDFILLYNVLQGKYNCRENLILGLIFSSNMLTFVRHYGNDSSRYGSHSKIFFDKNNPMS